MTNETNQRPTQHLRALLFCIVLLLLTSNKGYSQINLDSTLSKIDPQKWAASISKRLDKLEEKIVAKSLKTLDRLKRQEEKIARKLQAKDSTAAKSMMADMQAKYQALENKLKDPTAISSNTVRQYLPKLDTLTTALKFLDDKGVGGTVKSALSKASSFQNKLQQAEEIRKFIRNRRQQLREQLEKLGLLTQLKKFNKEVYYYSAQIKEYKELLKDSKKAERKAIDLLSKTKLFKDFMKKHSMLASLFRMPGDPSDPAYSASLAGLQTRAQVNSLIQQQIVAGGPNARQQFQHNLQQAQSQLQQLKNKILKGGAGSSDAEMPEGFKPNKQKTKSFLKRLEIGTNVQTPGAKNYFPVTSDLGLSVGYKLNDKSIIGIGASYKLGWGNGWRQIRITHQGAGLRSFIDWKIKGVFWISGGYEMNYRTVFDDISDLKNLSAWQQSGLLGLSKSIPIKSKFFEKTKLQLLWDFLSYEQRPRTQPIIFRVGYNLK